MRAVVRAVAVAAMAIAGCDADPAPREPALPEVAVTVVQQRVDEATRTVGVEATNSGAHPVHVSSVRLSGSGLDAPTTPLDTDLQPGLTVALRTSYGNPDCTDRTGSLVATLEIGGELVALPVDAAGEQEMERLLDVECAGRALAASVSVRLSGPYREVVVGGQPQLRGRLVLIRRAPGDALDVRSLGGSVLIDLRPAGQLQDLGADADRAVTPVLLGSSGRCDAHALGGSTQTFLLSAYVRLGDGPEQRVVLTPSRRVQGAVLQVVDRACDATT
jgi:hypothetical protein